MKKTTTALLLAVVCCYGTIRGQDLATWNLTNNDVASFQSTHTNAGKLTRGKGISLIDFSSNGASASAWESSPDISGADYYEICLKPKPGYLLDVSSLSFTEMRTDDGIRSYRLKWSLDGFETFGVLADVTVPDDVNSRTVTHPNLNIRICDGQELCLRWYGYDTDDYNGEWYLSNVVITGTESAACNPPAAPVSNLSIANIAASSMDVSWVPGGGDATIVLAVGGSPESLALCGGKPYNADPDFGMGTSLGKGTFVVYNGPGTSFTLSGLEGGATYALTAISYNTAGGCYQNDNLPVASATTLCGAASEVVKMRSSPSDGQMTLAWEPPLCYDEVMVVASSSAITSLPTSGPAAYTANPTFTPLASPDGGLVAGEAIVYRGTDTQTAVAGLANDQPYHFKIYAFRNGSWTAGAEVVKTPMAGCNFLGGDFIYINELHFNNKITDIDKGIEIAGRAGIELENYVLAIYTNQGNLDRTITLSGLVPDQLQGYGAVWVPDPELPVHSAVALVNTVTGVTTDFIAHRVAPGVVANDGPAAGQPAFWQGRNEDPNTPVNYSIQRQGDIACPNTSLEWVGPAQSSRGQLNFAQSMFPITLLAFEGRLEEDQVFLSWKTESEENNDYMAVEHSPDGRHFKEIGRVKGAGTTTETQSYHLRHNQPQPGLNYYRLRQVDFDGAFSYHGPVAVEYKGKGTGIRAFPRLAAGQLTVQLSAPAGQEGELLACDINGRPVLRRATAPGFLREELDVSALPPGHYFLQWRSPKGVVFKDRFVKL